MRVRSSSWLRTWLAILAVLQVVACDNGATEPEDDGYPWAGVYQAETRAGGASGAWVAAGTLEITKDARVFVDGEEMQNTNVEYGVIWTIKGGNPHSGAVVFQDGSVGNGIWGQEGQEGVLFQGWFQNPGEERRDYRGLRQ
jgi:hypothetical protein